MKKTILGLASVIAITGCATAPDKIGSTYVSPLQYQNYDCQQIAGELDRVTRHAGELNTDLAKKATNDTIKTTVGMILFFPALFFLDGNSPQAAEYGRLKGERDTLEKIAVEKKCLIAPLPPINTVKKIENKPEGSNTITSNVSPN